MRVRVARLPRPNVEEEHEVPEGARVMDLLRSMGIPPDAVIVVRDRVPIALDSMLAPQERLSVIRVFSGG